MYLFIWRIFKFKIIHLAFILALSFNPQIFAADAQVGLNLETRAKHITTELRCLVCQNQTIADSNSELAQDLRREVRTLLGQGRSDVEVVDYMTARYGDFVRYRPPVKPSTWLLWGAPALLVVGGFLTLAWVLRRRSRLSDERFEMDEFDDSANAQELRR
jgi:cytochrome c-type biogenesis protein CcmH